MNNVKVILIDSGISKEQYQEINDFRLSGNLYNEYFDFDNHGSAIYSILKSYNLDVECIKITKNDEITEVNLIEVLEKILNYKNLKNIVINMSLGITYCEQKTKLYNLCKKLAEHGCILVSAFDNNGAVSYPAAFDCVIGVDISIKCKKINHFEYVQNSIVNIRGFGGAQLLPNNCNVLEKFVGSSFVAPHISAIIAQQMCIENIDFKAALNYLKIKSTKIYPSKKYKNNQYYDKSKIKKAIVLPLNKEIINLIRNSKLIDFNIAGVYDFHYMKTINKNTSEFIGEYIGIDYTIKNINDINWEDDFDTVIMGHMFEINETLHKDYTRLIIDNCIKYNKFLYAFDSLKKYNLSLIKNNLYYPSVDKNNVPPNRFGKLFQIHCPVMGIFGTSSKQGKFTLQLKLRDKFLENNFNIAQLSTEPNGLLFGMDAIYPMGYGNNIQIAGYDEIMVINNTINSIVDDETSILLIGSQSQTVAYSSQNLSLFPLGNLNLLLATFPDIIILCINFFDNIEYIKRSISYLEGVVDSKVIALVISPFLQEYTGSTLVRNIDFVSKTNLAVFKDKINREIKIATYILNEEQDIDDLYEMCVETLS